jgi:hypothetical protein
MMSAELKLLAVLEGDDGIISLAKLAGAFDDGFQHRGEVGRRGGDHVEDVGAAGLVFQRLLKVVRLGLHLLEQTYIADRDHRLVGEGHQQGDLVISKWLHYRAAQNDYADGFAFAHQRDRENRASSVLTCDIPAVGKFRPLARQDVTQVNGPALDNRAPRWPLTVDRPSLPGDGNRPMLRLKYEVITILQGYVGIVRLTKPASALNDRLENWLDVGRR